MDWRSRNSWQDSRKMQDFFLLQSVLLAPSLPSLLFGEYKWPGPAMTTYLRLVLKFIPYLPPWGRLRLKCDGTRAVNRFRLSAKRTSPFKLAGASVQSATGSRGVCISGSNARYNMFRGSMKSTGYPLHSPVSPPLSLPCVTVCHHISTGLYQATTWLLHRHTLSGLIIYKQTKGLKPSSQNFPLS